MHSAYFDDYQRWTDETVTGNLRTIVGTPSELGYLCLGLVSEAREYFDAMYASDRMKEAGDIFWYSARICNHFNIEFSEIIKWAKVNYVSGKASVATAPLHLPAVFRASGLICDMSKKLIRDGRDVDHIVETKSAIMLNLSLIMTSILTDLTRMDEVVLEQEDEDPDYFAKLCMALVEGNKMKLNSRKERGVLGGSGDAR